MTAPLFYADAVPDAGVVVLRGEQARHAGALRVHPGERILVGDGAGRVGQGTVTAVQRGHVEVQVRDVRVRPAPREVHVVQGLPKGERGDLAVELLTETGASTITPWAAQRAVADWRGKEQAKQQRWHRVAVAAAMQSRRPFVPTVESLQVGVPGLRGTGLVLHESAGASLFALDIPDGPLTVVVGPEGGLSDDEVSALREQGAQVVGLGDRILRTSTAGAAACVWIRGFETRRGA
jgi:16S rRNA (uracil1498-N3)-methyltransferase